MPNKGPGIPALCALCQRLQIDKHKQWRASQVENTRQAAPVLDLRVEKMGAVMLISCRYPSTGALRNLCVVNYTNGL